MPSNFDKLIALDLDGTLLNKDNSVSAENLAAIERAGRQRAIVVIVTGRPYVSADAVARRLALPPVPLVTFNGAVIRHPGGGPILTQQLVPADLATEVLNECLDLDLHLHFYINDEMYVNRNDHWAQLYCLRSEMDCHEVEDMRAFSGRAAIKLLTIDQPEIVEARLRQFQQRWNNQLYVTRSMPEYIEFLSPYATKGLALDWLIDFFGVERMNTLAIGDAMNDLPLFERAGFAAAMPEAEDSLKELAQFLPPNQETGVAAAMNWFLNELG